MFSSSLRIASKGLGRITSNASVLKRQFFSPEFYCEKSWKKRLEAPIIKKCVLENFYFELDNKYSQSEQISSIDVDIFVNALKDNSHVDEMQDLVHKLRLSDEACNILPSTHHGLIRVLLDCKKYEDLMAVLNDRLNYGIFPDAYCSLLMFDVFLRKKDYKNASKVATLHMLQEDVEDPLIQYLSLFSCHNYLLNPTEWEPAKDLEPPEEDKEERKVRVPYLRNPYFDDHFDLIEANDLIGKTLVMIGEQAKGDIGRSYQLLGYILHKKFSLAQSFLKSIIENKQTIHKDVVDLISKHVEEMKGDNANAPEEKSDEGLNSIYQEIISSNSISDNLILPLVEEKVKHHISKNEDTIIASQESTYEEWIETRDRILKETLDRLNKEERLSEVKRVKDELVKREEQLFFFDREDQLDLEIEKKDVMVQEESAKRGSSQTKGSSADDYIPPEIVKQRHTD